MASSERTFEYRVTAHDPETMREYQRWSAGTAHMADPDAHMALARRGYRDALLVLARRTVSRQADDVGSWEIVRTEKP